MKYTFREIKTNEMPKVMELYDIVIKALDGKDYLRPFTQETIDTFYDDAVNMAAFDGDKLIGMGRLRTKEREGLAEYKRALGLDGTVAECSSYLVLPEYRGQGIMKKIQSLMFEYVRKLGFKYALAAVHPENIASRKVLEKKLNPFKTIRNSYGSDRTLYLAEL